MTARSVNTHVTPLIVACSRGNVGIVQALLRKHADISSPHKLISTPNLSKHLTTSQLLWYDATNNGDCPQLLRKLISAPALNKHSTTSFFWMLQ
jgi:ankyrin repeat protein